MSCRFLSQCSILIVCILIFSSNALAYKTPDFTPNEMDYLQALTVYPLEKGDVVLQLLPFYYHDPTYNSFGLPLNFQYGFTDKLFLCVTFGVFNTQRMLDMLRVYGVGDLNLALQYSIMYVNNTNNHISFAFNVNLPTSDVGKGFTDGFVRFAPTFIFAHDSVHPKWIGQLFGQVLLSLVDRIKSPRGATTLTPAAHELVVNLGYAIRTQYLNYSVEVNWFNNRWNNHGQLNILYITPGFFFLTKSDLEIGIGAAFGVTRQSDQYRILANITYTLPMPKSQ